MSSLAEAEIAETVVDKTQPTSSRWRWIYSTVLLCSYGFFKEFLPSEPYLTAYLDNETNASKQFNFDDVNNEIYPWWPYSYLVAVFILFMFTDVLRYKPIVVVEVLSQIVTRVLLIWGTTLLEMKLMQVTYGIATAAEIAYYSYIYVLVSPVHFRKVTGYIEASRLFGAALAGYAAQALVSTGTLNLLQLQYISFASVCVGCLFALALPNVWYPSFRAILVRAEGEQLGAPCTKLSTVIRSATHNRWRDFKKFYTSCTLAPQVVCLVGPSHVRLFPGPELRAKPVVGNCFDYGNDLPVQRFGGRYRCPLWVAGGAEHLLPWSQLVRLGRGGHRGTLPR